MSSSEPIAVGTATEVRYYERGAVRVFLEQAEAARGELEHALHHALVREERAQAALEQTRYAAVDLETEAAALGEALREEREAAWAVVATTIADAEAEAAAILAAAELEAAALRAEPVPPRLVAGGGAPAPVGARRPPSLDRLVGHPLRTARLLAG